jgi:hypothetical protein
MALRFFLTILIFTFANAFAATKPVTIEDCEKLVIGKSGQSALSKIGLWLVDTDLSDLEVHRIDISVDNLVEDHVYESSGVMDNTPTKFKGGPIQDAELTPYERKAFGITGDVSVKTKNLRAKLKSRQLKDLKLETFDGDKKIGETVLHAGLARIGFTNRLQHYQSFWASEGFDTDINSFFGDHGYVLLPADNGFAFVFSLAAIEKPVGESEYMEFTVFAMRNCPGRDALLMKDFIFPMKDTPSGSKNICLDDLGLKLVLPYKGED